MDFSSELHIKLKDARKRKGLTQADVASQLNISRQAISRWENASSYPDLDNLTILSELYDISLDELLGQRPPHESTIPDQKSFHYKKALSEKLEPLIFFLILIITSQAPFIGTIVSIYIFIWILRNRKQYKLMLFVAIISILLSLYVSYDVIKCEFPENSSYTIEKVSFLE